MKIQVKISWVGQSTMSTPSSSLFRLSAPDQYSMFSALKIKQNGKHIHWNHLLPFHHFLCLLRVWGEVDWVLVQSDLVRPFPLWLWSEALHPMHWCTHGRHFWTVTVTGSCTIQWGSQRGSRRKYRRAIWSRIRKSVWGVEGGGVVVRAWEGGRLSLLRSHEWFLLWSLALPQLVLVHISIAPLSMPTSAA